MARDFVTVSRRMADIDQNVDGENFLARTVYEDHELIDTGVVDANGDKIMARKRPDQVGFIRWSNGRA